jgi:WD40 repeat protein
MFRDMAKKGSSEFIAFLRDRKLNDISTCLVDLPKKRKLPEMPDVLNIATLKGRVDGAHLVWFSPDGQILASASEKLITLWNVSTKE